MSLEQPWQTPIELAPSADTTQKEMSNKTETKRYTTESGMNVDLVWKESVAPETEANRGPDAGREEYPQEEGVIFLPGWAMGADAKAGAALGKAFAENSHSRAYTITTRAEKISDDIDSLYEQAQAISKFVKEKGLKEVTLAGHSQGGDKAIDVAAILQEDPEMKIRGLVLLDSVGLYEQDPSSLAKGFAKDSLVKTPKTLMSKAVRNPQVMMQGVRAMTDIVFGIAKEISRSKTGYPSRLKNEISEMARVNPRLSTLRMPIVLMSGSNDPVSNPEKIMPPGEEEKILKAWEKEKESLGSAEFIDPREEFLKNNIFPQSPYVRMVIPEKLGHHGLPLFRSKSVANVSLYLLRRFERREKPTTE